MTTAQNGPNVAVTRYDVFNSYGKLIWSQDEQGFLTYRDYDLNTCAMSKLIVDVDTTVTGEFTNLPTGWTTPTGGGLNLITLYTIDNMGRTTVKTWPNGRIDYTVFDDVNHESRFYPAWDPTLFTSGGPTGPTQVSRQDRSNNYGETFTMSAAPDVSGGVPTGTEAISDLQSLSRGIFNTVGQLVEQDQYFDFTGLTYSTTPYLGTAGTNFYATTYEYDNRDRVIRTLTPQGTVFRTDYDFLSRTTAQWTGTSDANVVQTAAFVYDGGGVGDGNLTSSTQIPSGVLGSADDRVTQTWFDWRNRAVATKSGVQSTEATTVHRPIIFVVYDNLNRVVTSQRYDGDGVTITVTAGEPVAPSSSLLRAQSATAFDEQGRVYLSQTWGVDPASGTVTSTALSSNSYYDYRGNLIASSPPGGLWNKSVYDGAGRTTITYATDGAGGTSWSAAGSVASDTVLEQTETGYDSNSNVWTTTLRQRFDDATGTGALGTPTSGIAARVYYQGFYYDLADRITDSVNVGTNPVSGVPTAWTRPGTVPSRSTTVLVNSTSYDAAGRVLDGTDPKGLVLRSLYDFAGRTTTTIEDYTGATPTNDTDKTTNFGYNSAGTTSLSAILSGGTDHQTTQWNYGVTTPTSNLNSDEIAAVTEYPNPTTGDPSTSEEETITVNAVGQTLTMTDRNGNVHTYTYDVLGRLTLDAVTTLGTGVDGSVRSRAIAYDTQGNAYLFTTYNNAVPGSGTVVNQVQRAFNGLGQMITEWQQHTGAVNTSTSAKVQYAFNYMVGGANNSRSTSITYPALVHGVSTGRVIDYNYASGIDSTISRLTSMINDSDSTVLESYTYLGVGTVVKRSHAEPGVNLTYIKLSGESNGDAGDKYIGLDRFGRVVDQRWINSSNTDVDRFQYGYDANSNRTSRTNTLNSSFNETYTYDNLNQLSTFALGSSLTQNWGYDAVGNWLTFETNSTTQTRTHNRLNEITSISGATTPTYDANGNTTTDNADLSYTYDAWNFPIYVNSSLDAKNISIQAGLTTIKYVYDALSRRIHQSGPMVSSHARDFYYSANWQVLHEQIAGGLGMTEPRIPIPPGTGNQYVWSPVYIDCMVLCDFITYFNSSPPTSVRYYPTQDANFNATALVDTTGTVQERYTYTPFGVVSYWTASWGTRTSSSYSWIYLFQGGRLDNNTSKYYFRFRDYSPTLGRWIINDPIRFAGGDALLTAFCNNNPLSVLDPFGLYSFTTVPGPASNVVVDTPAWIECHNGEPRMVINDDANINRKYGKEQNSMGAKCYKWVRPCIKMHEQYHLDIINKGPNPCIGKNNGDRIKPATMAEKNLLETLAYSMEIECLQKILKSIDLPEECRRYVELFMEDTKIAMQPFIEGVLWDAQIAAQAPPFLRNPGNEFPRCQPTAPAIPPNSQIQNPGETAAEIISRIQRKAAGIGTTVFFPLEQMFPDMSPGHGPPMI